MTKLSMYCLCVLSVMSLAAAVPSFSYAHIIDPEGRNIAAVVPDESNQYLYEAVSPMDYAVAEYYEPTGLDIWDYVSSPITVVKVVLQKVWSVTKWVVAKGSLIALGVALALGFCGITNICSISFEKYPVLDHGYRSILESSALNTVEDFVYRAIDKFKNYQN